MKITSNARPIGLIGHPIEHSYSPKLHNAIYEKYGINNVYLAFDVETEDLQNAIGALKVLSFAGFNVTVPHKQEVLHYLDEVDDEARVIGAVNTVKLDNGRLIGYNTDGLGFISSLNNRGHNVKGMNVLVLGAGGSSRSICVYLAKEGVSMINIHNRTESNARALAEHLNKHYISTEVNVVGKSGLTDLNPDLIINTTSIGMWPHTSESPLKNYVFSPNQLVVDIIYNPRQTKFLKDAEDAGCCFVNGLDMLVGQAIKAIEIWTGDIVDYDFALKVLST